MKLRWKNCDCHSKIRCRIYHETLKFPHQKIKTNFHFKEFFPSTTHFSNKPDIQKYYFSNLKHNKNNNFIQICTKICHEICGLHISSFCGISIYSQCGKNFSKKYFSLLSWIESYMLFKCCIFKINGTKK